MTTTLKSPSSGSEADVNQPNALNLAILSFRSVSKWLLVISTMHNAHFFTLLLGFLLPVIHSHGQQPDLKRKLGTTISIVDDSSGGDAQGVITAETASHLRGLLALVGKDGLTLRFALIQESLATPVSLTIEGWHPQIGTPPSRTLPFDQYTAAARAYAEDLKRLGQEKSNWVTNSTKGFEAFLAEAVDSRLKLDARWLVEIERIGSDFSRSSCADTIVAAAEACNGAAKAFIILATDGEDRPGGGREPRTTPLTREEVSDTIRIIIINASGTKPDSPLFSEINDRAVVVRDLAEAVDLITTEAKEPSTDSETP